MLKNILCILIDWKKKHLYLNLRFLPYSIDSLLSIGWGSFQTQPLGCKLIASWTCKLIIIFSDPKQLLPPPLLQCYWSGSERGEVRATKPDCRAYNRVKSTSWSCQWPRIGSLQSPLLHASINIRMHENFEKRRTYPHHPSWHTIWTADQQLITLTYH